MFWVGGLTFRKELKRVIDVFEISAVPVEFTQDACPIKAGLRGAGALGVLLFHEFECPDTIYPVRPVFLLFSGFSDVSKTLRGDNILAPGFTIIRRVCGSGTKQQNGASREGHNPGTAAFQHNYPTVF
jgi:hypothetical protein